MDTRHVVAAKWLQAEEAQAAAAAAAVCKARQARLQLVK